MPARPFVLGLLFLLPSALLAQPDVLPFRPIFVEYSKSVNQLVMASDGPPQLHLYEPVSRSLRSISLAKRPESLRLSPDGRRAAVGHDLLVSWVNLDTATVDRTFLVPFQVTQADASSAWIWARGATPSGASINLTTGEIIPTSSVVTGDSVYSPRLGAILVSTNTSYLAKIDVSSGPMGQVYTSPLNAICPGLQQSADEVRLYSGCAVVARSGATATDDPEYETSLNGVSRLRSVAELEGFGHIAAIPDNGSSPIADDSYVWLFDSGFFNPSGGIALDDYPGGVRARGRWVFFNRASMGFYAVSQSEANVGPGVAYGVHILPQDVPSACAVTLQTDIQRSPAAGILGKLQVTAARNCRYQVETTGGIEVIDRGFTAGSRSLSYIVRRNPSPFPRTGTLSVHGVRVTIVQEGATTPGPVRRIGYRVLAAAYSRPLDRMVLISDRPHELHIYEPKTGFDTVVPLPRPPRAVTVSPDGNFALIGHDGWVSYVGLVSGSVFAAWRVGAIVDEIRFSRNGYAYFRGITDAYAFRVPVTPTDRVSATRFASLVYGSLGVTADGDYLYSLSLFRKWDIRGGMPIPLTVAGSVCDPGWVYPDGQRIFTSCANLLDTSSTPAVTVAGLPDATTATWADRSSLRQSLAVLPGNEFGQFFRIGIYGETSLAPAGQVRSPTLEFEGRSYSSLPQQVFWNAAENGFVSVVRARDFGAEPSPFALHIVAASSPAPGCVSVPQRLLVNAPFHGGVDSIPVQSGPDCPWVSTSSAPWVNITSGGFGAGSANVALTLDPNTSGLPRSTTLTVAGASVTVTQAAVACTFALSSSTASSGAGASATSVSVTAPPGCGWSAISNAAWLNVTTGATGIGAAGVSIAIAANTGAVFRTGTLTIAGLPFTVTQAGAGAPDPVFQDVPPSHPFYESIGQLHANGITAGCSVAPRLFCPDSSVTRAQMAVLIVTALNKRLRVPLTYPASPYFEDVRPPSPYFPFVQRIRELEITAGCSAVPPLFCGEASITHGQMAVFIIAAWMQANNLTSFTWPATPYFTDVPASHPFFRFIQKMRELGFWSGCSANQYCDTSPVTRGQMSPMIVKGILGAP